MSDFTCSKCGGVKPESYFYKDSSKKSGRSSRCKSCCLESKKKYYKDNRDKILDTKRDYYQSNREKILEERKELYPSVREQRLSYLVEYREKHRDRINSHNREYYKNNKEVHDAKSSRRRALKISATPLWANQGRIEEIYREARFASSLSGEKYHVDHIVPLVSGKVCGLHVEDNLQIIPAQENLQKSNSFSN